MKGSAMRRTSFEAQMMLPPRWSVSCLVLLAFVPGCSEEQGQVAQVYSLPTPERHRWPSEEEIRRRGIEILAENKERDAKEMLTKRERLSIDRVGGPAPSWGYNGPQADTNILGRYQPNQGSQGQGYSQPFQRGESYPERLEREQREHDRFLTQQNWGMQAQTQRELQQQQSR